MSDLLCDTARMNKHYEHFKSAVAGVTQPVILLAGSRKVPENLQEKLVMLAAYLANEFPTALFRSGNADGSDALFARGVNAIAPARLQLITPTAGHRRVHRNPLNYSFPLNNVSAVHEETLAYHTNTATPGNARIIDKRNEIPQLQSKARYLLRDTLMVMGDPAQELLPATMGIFFTASDPMAGGTGHTIRVCKQNNVPVFLPPEWWRWME
ncbi:hypothetical protein P4C99_11165 [Pontiellaceae bacterium B1224]|nr:hypothetical protein [Pontiellaceae bacterium B1224]